MAYGKREKKRAQVRFNGKRSTSVVNVESETVLDTHAQSGAVVPNFIHSLDASALVFALNNMEGEGVGGVCSIHDSVGGLATEMSTMSKAVRKGFVRLYSEHDPLRSFYVATVDQASDVHRASIPEPPMQGSLNIQCVAASTYFFA